MTVLLRFDPSTSKEAMIISCLTLWELIRTLAKLENIDLEHITPYYPDIVRSAHVTLFVLPINSNKEILVDIANTVLTSWPKLMDITIGFLGKLKPIELHFVVPGSKGNKYWHASAKLSEFDSEGVNKLIAYQGIHNKHRKPTTKHLKAIIEIMNPIIPELSSKASAIVETIRNAAAHIAKRVNLLAACWNSAGN